MVFGEVFCGRQVPFSGQRKKASVSLFRPTPHSVPDPNGFLFDNCSCSILLQSMDVLYFFQKVQNILKKRTALPALFLSSGDS